MRFITKAAVVAGALATGVSLTAGPALAASSWSATHSFKNMAAWGTYAKGRSGVRVNANLQDQKVDGYTACVNFRFTQGKASSTTGFYCIVNSRTHQPVDAKATVRFQVPSNLKSHLYVQEGRYHTGWHSIQGGSWKRVY